MMDVMEDREVWRLYLELLPPVGNQAFPSTTKKSNTRVHEPQFFSDYDCMRNEKENHVR